MKHYGPPPSKKIGRACHFWGLFFLLFITYLLILHRSFHYALSVRNFSKKLKIKLLSCNATILLNSEPTL